MMKTTLSSFFGKISSCRSVFTLLFAFVVSFFPLHAENADEYASEPSGIESPGVSSTDSVKTGQVAPKKKSLAERLRRDKNVENANIILMNAKNGGREVSQDSLRKLIRRFYFDQFRHFRDPEAPYFFFMSRDASAGLGVGGTINTDVWYDWGGSIPDYGFKIYDIPIPADKANRRRLGSSFSGSSIFFTLLGKNRILGSYKTYIAMLFSGWPSATFQIDKAYLTFRDWTIGYATSTFADPMALAPQTDDACANGNMNKTNVLLRYLHTSKDNHWSAAASIEFPTQEIMTRDTLTRSCAPDIPEFAAFGQYQWDDGDSHVRLSGIARWLAYRDLAEQRNNRIFGWGLQLSTVAHVSTPLTLYAIANCGKGVASYLNDLAGKNYELVSSNQPGRMYAPFTYAGIAGMKYNWTPFFYSDVILSGVRYDPKGQQMPDEYKYGVYGAVNTIWDATSRMTIGIEYLHGLRCNYNGDHASANRINILFRLHF